MRKNITSVFFVAVGAAFLLMNDAFAGTLTVTSGPTFTPPGAFTFENIDVQQVNPDLVKLFGDATLAITPDSTVTIEIGGNFSGLQGEKFSAFYDFTIDLNSVHPVSFSLKGFANGNEVLNETGDVDPGVQRYTGTFEFTLPINFSGTWDGVVEFNFGNNNPLSPQADPETLELHIEQILLQLAPTAVVPEPSTVAFLALGLGGLAIGLRRRRAALSLD